MAIIKRLYVEKKREFSVVADHLLQDLKSHLSLTGLTGVRVIIRYDIEDISESVYTNAVTTVFSEPPVDNFYENELPLNKEMTFAVEYLPGQYDQRADSAVQCIQIMAPGENPSIKTAIQYIFSGNITNNDLGKIKKYLINPVDSREAKLIKPETLLEKEIIPEDVKYLIGFINKSENDIKQLRKELGLAMSDADLLHCQKYFKDDENRDPSITEIKMLDTYWSDHCRHTTFLTRLKNITFDDGKYSKPIKESYNLYLKTREKLYVGKNKDISLMDMAVLAAKDLRSRGLMGNLEESEEVNACSIIVPVDINGKEEEWLLQFKNETHNHPTEIEPFGGAATCLGGCIRDPLSGRSYVYQAMRVTGAGSPLESIEDTIPGKLPQRKICTEAAHGYSSYGNQIGLATGNVSEIYHSGYKAKRMEIGAVIAAAPRENVTRASAEPGDIIVLTGGKTGRDGCGGATGSSKEHTEESIETSGAEVQKGNAPVERKIQRLFRNPEASKMIKICNDFGAGGVSVAIAELADGLIINLDVVPKKYNGLDGTELTISESQERMAVVLNPKDVKRFIELADEENLEAVEVAVVTEDPTVKITWRGKEIVSLKRPFINTNGVLQDIDIQSISPTETDNWFNSNSVITPTNNIKQDWLKNLADLNVCSQKGLIETFDSTIGASSVLLPFGGKTQQTPTDAMCAKIPVLNGDTNAGSLMSWGFDPDLSTWSPYHGAAYAVVESAAKVVAAGGELSEIRLTFQEYFEKLGTDPKKWGKPFNALLGAYQAQTELKIGAIGGKDSMSGTFEDIHVPPTLVSFAVAPVNVNYVISPEFKEPGNKVYHLPLPTDEYNLPAYSKIEALFNRVTTLIRNREILSAQVVRKGGIAAAVSKMSFGNQIGVEFNKNIEPQELYKNKISSFVVEMKDSKSLEGLDFIELGKTLPQQEIIISGTTINLTEALENWEKTLEDVYPIREKDDQPQYKIEYKATQIVKPKVSIAKPRVIIPVFPGTNCEYDSAKAFTNAGAIADTFVIKNLTEGHIKSSINEMVKRIDNSQIIMIPGGFSAGDEPEGSAKFIAAFFRNPEIKDAVSRLLNQRDGLMLGICNGFQALIKLGLVPYGEIRDIDANSPTLTYNTIGRHISQMVETKVVSNLSPWLQNCSVGDTHQIALSHGEGRFIADLEYAKKLAANGQIATQYLGHNPNGSIMAIEGITSPDGRVLGKMGHSERVGTNVCKNIYGEKDQQLFRSGVNYFK
ncbi:MAG: phosphoribosylformylglycinamidine synthase [Spirochaetales bacterium]|nr:phosphoribosylformylglycinamidine synthase [Spirochaetales bacterium]